MIDACTGAKLKAAEKYIRLTHTNRSKASKLLHRLLPFPASMFHVGVALLAFLVPSVLPCTVHVGNNLREATLSKDPLIHVHVVVYGKVFCASRPDLRKASPLKVKLDVGVRQADPSNYQLLR